MSPIDALLAFEKFLPPLERERYRAAVEAAGEAIAASEAKAASAIAALQKRLSQAVARSWG